MNALNILVSSLSERINQHAEDMEKLRLKCEYVGAPIFMHELMVVMSEKTSFDINKGSAALLQPFISGKLSQEDALQISESTGWVINALNISSVSAYENELALLYAKLK